MDSNNKFEQKPPVENNSNNINNNNYIKQKNIDELLSYKDIKNFNPEEFLIRKYNKNNVKAGKMFFKYRYTKNKIEEIPQNNAPRNSVMVKDMDLLNNAKHKRISSNTVNIKLLEEIFSDKKDLRYFNSKFLTIVEKSIFHFNFKKYKESYTVLLQEKIINTETEFGEFLLVVNGYDKNVLGTFLSKNKSPNEKKEVIKGFINSIDLKYEKFESNNNNNYFLECLRFLLSRLNLPQDANLILEIMDTYSTFIFDINKDDKEFISKYSSINAIYLLISTLLALNTMFTRKDIKNMNIIKRDQFLEMNKEIEKNEAIDIYNKLEKEPISMSYNYNDIIYQKMALLVIENDNNKNINTFLKKSISSLLNNNSKIKSIEMKDDNNKDDEDKIN